MKTISESMFLLFCFFFFGSKVSAHNVVTDWASMATITVTNLLDNGAGSLRQVSAEIHRSGRCVRRGYPFVDPSGLLEK